MALLLIPLSADHELQSNPEGIRRDFDPLEHQASWAHVDQQETDAWTCKFHMSSYRPHEFSPVTVYHKMSETIPDSTYFSQVGCNRISAWPISRRSGRWPLLAPKGRTDSQAELPFLILPMIPLLANFFRESLEVIGTIEEWIKLASKLPCEVKEGLLIVVVALFHSTVGSPSFEMWLVWL